MNDKEFLFDVAYKVKDDWEMHCRVVDIAHKLDTSLEVTRLSVKEWLSLLKAGLSYDQITMILKLGFL